MLLHRGCTWLTLMPLLLSLSTGELNFYRDALSETSEDIALKHLARYLEAQRLQQRLHRSHLSPFLSPMHKKHVQKERDLLEALTNKVDLANLLKLNAWMRHRQHQYQDSINQIVPDYLLPYLNVKLGYPEVPKPNEDDSQDYKENLGYGYRPQTNDGDLRYEQPFDTDKEMMEEPMMKYHGRYMDREHAGVLHEGGREPAAQLTTIGGPKFTYQFDNSNLKERHPFAVKPNNPRYNDAPFSSDDLDEDASVVKWNSEKATDEEEAWMKHEDDTRDVEQKASEDLIGGSDLDASETEKSAAHHPLIMPINRDLNKHAYFIAIIAGCCAVAMFALVLICLTWCRLRHGAKAAADIEYPAYGVTGPNKEVSPSGDQRLAQSAQMYHFQHQKQQIIAMENRTSATRDPGSLSEAESDEENEEGDYTVYECPGLASTGEMEVKNPMFHDDPTPATPAHSNNKEEDHI